MTTSTMIHEHFSAITEVRPGRSMFARCLLIGTDNIAETTINLVCAHGMMGSCKQFGGVWEPLADLLAASPSTKMAVWMFDQLGCGRTPGSPSASDFTDIEIERDIAGLITARVGLSKPILFMGHSYAAQTILKLVRDFPDIHKEIRPR